MWKIKKKNVFLTLPLATSFKTEGNVKAYKLSDNLKHLLDQYTDDLTVYLEHFSLMNRKNINAVLDTLEKFCILSGLKINRGKTKGKIQYSNIHHILYL